MPGFDGTGPMGQGPMTGGGRGDCAVPVPGGQVRGGGWGYGRGGRGRGGYGRRNGYRATGMPGWMRAQQGMQAYGPAGWQGAPGEELIALRDQAGVLKEQLAVVESRLQALEGDLGAEKKEDQQS